MAANVRPEEAQALHDAFTGALETRVVERDFRRPQRLAPARSREIARAVRAALAPAARALRGILGRDVTLELADVEETSSEELHAEEGPLVALGFTIKGRSGCALWEPTAAVRAVERTLGAAPDADLARALSPLEGRLAERVLTALVKAVAEGLERRADAPFLASERDALADGGEERCSDPYRLAFSIALVDGGQRSGLRLLLPWPAETPAEPPVAGELPPHLEPVEVEARAVLASCELFCRELVELEEGDVVPLTAAVGDPVRLSLEGRSFARGRLGTRNSRLAVRIEELEERS